MRILFVDQTSQLGGAELCLMDLVLARQGNDRVFLFQTGPLEEMLRAAGVDVAVQSIGGGSEVRKDSGLARKLTASTAVLGLARSVAKAAADMDVIYANTPKALVVAAIASWLSRKPLVYHLHDILSREHFSPSNLWLLVWLSNRRAAHVIANSQATKTAYLAAGGRAPVTVIYNGFDASVFENWTSDRVALRQQLRQQLGLVDAIPVVGVFGRFAPWKGQHVAIAAIKDLPSVHLWLVGDAVFGEETYKRELQRMAAEPDVLGRVHFLGFRSDVGPLMQAVDVVVHCSTAPEPFGRVLVEAMMSRRPLIAAGAGGALEIVEHGQTGLLSRSGDPQALGLSIRQTLDSPIMVQEMTEKAFRSALARFSFSSVLKETERVLAAIC